MNTITSYKVVYIDAYGDLQEYDYGTEEEARRMAATQSDSIIYRVRILGEIERLT